MRPIAPLFILLVGCTAATTSTREPSALGARTEAPAPNAAAASKPKLSGTSQSAEPLLATSAATDADAPATEPVEKEPEPPPPLPEGTVVLHVGSSTAGALGLDLKKDLEALGVKCLLRSKHSTYIPEWAGPKMGLRQMVARYKPDLVIVSVGGNEVEIPDPTRRIKPIKRLVEAIGDRPCVWVGTPRWKRLHHTGLMEVIRDNASPCRFVDSDVLAPNLQTIKDGVHPTMPERKRWARRMLEWLQVNRDPNGEKPWSFKDELVIPPDFIEQDEE
jgi:acyl-CoA thioesterase-1